MAFPRDPDEPYRSAPSDEEIRRRAAANEMPPRPPRFDDEFQPDAELTEGPASSGRIVAYAIAALLIVGAVLYGIARTSTSDTTPTASSPPVQQQPGTTTGAAPLTSPPTAPAPTPAPQQNNPAPAPSDSGTTPR